MPCHPPPYRFLFPRSMNSIQTSRAPGGGAATRGLSPSDSRLRWRLTSPERSSRDEDPDLLPPIRILFPSPHFSPFSTPASSPAPMCTHRQRHPSSPPPKPLEPVADPFLVALAFPLLPIRPLPRGLDPLSSPPRRRPQKSIRNQSDPSWSHTGEACVYYPARRPTTR